MFALPRHFPILSQFFMIHCSSSFGLDVSVVLSRGVLGSLTHSPSYAFADSCRYIPLVHKETLLFF